MKFFARQSACLVGILAVICAAMLLFPEAARAAGACSPDVGKVTLNEYNYIDNFTEVRKISSDPVDMTSWKVTVYTANRTAVGSLPAGAGSSCFGGLYQVNQFASNEISQNADIVLSDKNGDIVDIVRVRTTLPVTTGFYPATIPTCSFVNGSYDLLVSSSNKGVDRFADGTGKWRNTPGTGNNSFQSRCGPNITGGSADLAITKSANFTSVVTGDGVTYTITVTNNGTDTATNVLVDEQIPNGSSYYSHSASAGTYSYTNGVWNIGTLAVGAKATLTLSVVTTQVGTVTNTVTVAANEFDPITSNNSVSVNVTATTPPSSRLDAVEQGAGPGTTQGSRIYTKLAGVAFNLDLLALNTSGSTPVINTGYNKTVTIQLVDAASSPSCGSMIKLQDVGTHAFTGSGKDNGRWTQAFNYPNAARNVKVRLIDNGSPSIVSCSSDNFAIRPHALVVANTAATNADPTGTSASATPAVKAGAPFTLTATAVVLPGVTTLTGYDGTPAIGVRASVTPQSVPPQIIAPQLIAHSGAIVAGMVSGSFNNAVSGVSTGTAFQYSEVGYFKFPPYSVSDTTFTGVDQPDDCVSTVDNTVAVSPNFSNTAVGGKYGCDIGNPSATNFIGRFYPYNFDLTSPVFKNRNDINTCDIQTTGAIGASSNSLTVNSASGFAVGDGIVVRGAGAGGADLLTTVTAIASGSATATFTLGDNASTTVSGAIVYRLAFSYEGEPMALGFTVKAQNGLSSPSVTQNYTGSWARGPVVLQAENNNNGTDLSSRLAPAPAASWLNGVYTLSMNNLQFTRATTPDGPFGNLQIGVAVNDPDGAVLLKRSMHPASTGDCNVLGTCTAVAVANTSMLFGRLKLSNAHGSELLNLPVPAETQFWNGMLFVTNTADSCTSLAASNMALVKTPAGCTSSLLGNVQLISGRANLILTRPNAACYVDLTADLGTTAENKTYLQGRWSSSTFTDNARARATFGIYKRGPVIYMREMY